MIELVDVSKFYQTRRGSKPVLEGINLKVTPGERLGILGRNGAGKSTLIRLIGGVESFQRGRINRTMTVSWPLAFAGGFHYALTGLDNLRFICRIYNVDIARATDFVAEFSELGLYLNEPIRHYSAGMRARLAFAISMAVEFDCFLIDEVVAVGDARFHARCNYELFEKRSDRAKIIVSHDVNFIRAHCSRAVVLLEGKLYHFDEIDDAYQFYDQTLQ